MAKIIERLAKVANSLDKQGFLSQANKLDDVSAKIIKVLAMKNVPVGLINQVYMDFFNALSLNPTNPKSFDDIVGFKTSPSNGDVSLPQKRLGGLGSELTIYYDNLEDSKELSMVIQDKRIELEVFFYIEKEDDIVNAAEIGSTYDEDEKGEYVKVEAFFYISPKYLLDLSSEDSFEISKLANGNTTSGELFNYVEDILKDFVYSKIVHEFTHLADPELQILKPEIYEAQQAEKNNGEHDYWKDSSEIRAFLNESMYQLKQNLSSLRNFDEEEFADEEDYEDYVFDWAYRTSSSFKLLIDNLKASGVTTEIDQVSEFLVKFVGEQTGMENMKQQMKG